MDKLLPVLQRDFPDFEAIKAFEAGIPVYFIRLAVQVLEKQSLSTFQIYFLHAVALGIKTHEEIAHLLGVDDRDLVSPGAHLLKSGYIQQGALTQDGERPILLTHEGRQALTENGPPPVPKRKIGQFHFNALTGVTIPLEENTWSVSRMGKEGLSLLPKKEQERPTLGVFTEKEVAEALAGARAFEDTDIIALLELKKIPQLEYIAPVTVVLLEHCKTGEPRLTIYQKGRQLRPEAVALQRMFENQQFKLPEDAATLQAERPNMLVSLPAEVNLAVQQLAHNEEILVRLEAERVAQEELQAETPGNSEKQTQEEIARDIKEELRIKREENAELRQQLQQQVEWLRTEEHRPWLLRALREAQQEIIIISPWLNRRACNDELCRLIGDAVKRGVRIRIGYGMGRERDTTEAARNRNNVQAVRGALNRHIPRESANLLEIKQTRRGTHQKILICDRTFAINSSFNWLSYAGGQDEGYRNETGTLFRQVEKVTELAQIALQELSF